MIRYEKTFKELVMKYDFLLNDNEVEEILNLDLSLGDRLKWFQERFSLEELHNSRKVKFIFSLIQGSRISGNIQNNPAELRCPNCNGKYVVRTYVGDLYYRLMNGTKKQKESEKLKFAKMGLHSNPYATGDYFTRDYLCLNCGIKWNGKYQDIYRDIEEIK